MEAAEPAGAVLQAQMEALAVEMHAMPTTTLAGFASRAQAVLAMNPDPGGDIANRDLMLSDRMTVALLSDLAAARCAP